MKNLRILNVMLMFAFLTSVLMSCETSLNADSEAEDLAPELTYQSIEANSLPTSAQTFITDNYSIAFVNAFAVTGNDAFAYETDIDNSFNVNFNTNGEVVGFGPAFSKRHRPKGEEGEKDGREKPENVEEIETSALPTIALTFIQDSLGGNEVIKALKVTEADAEIEYYVLVKEIGLVIFDADGNVEEVKSCNRHRESPIRGIEDVAEITVAELPEAAQTHLSENYPTAEVLKVISGTVEGVVQYGVFVKELGMIVYATDGALVEVIEMRPREKGGFGDDDKRPGGDKDGDKKPHPGVEITVEDLPEITQTYLSEHYADATINKVVKHEDKEGKLNGYAVIINDSTVLKFDETGAFVKADELPKKED